MGKKEKKNKKESKPAKTVNPVGLNNVKKANEQADPLDLLPSFQTFTKSGLDLSLETKRVGELGEEDKEWIFCLVESNMKEMYKAAKWGWNEVNKKAELYEDEAWYLIAREKESGKAVAFSHFRYDMDHEEDALYVYEIQLEDTHRRKGLGKFMMKVLELLMMKAEMMKIMLTVFKHNEAASTFFKSGLGYSVDETSPVATPQREVDYEILSRVNQRELKKRLEQKENCCRSETGYAPGSRNRGSVRVGG